MEHEQEVVLGAILDHLEVMGVPYFITGSIAGLHYGIDRATHDADIAFDASHRGFPRALADRIGTSMYIDVPENEIRQFNVITGESDFKVDFWPIGDDPFARSQLARRVRGRIFGRTAWFASIEDLVLSKLRWYAKSNSDLQWRDLTRMIALHCDTLDRAYLERWANDLGLREPLERLFEQRG